VAGRATLRFANASRLPLEFTGFADNVALYVRELEQLAEDMRAQTEETNRRIEEGIYTAALDPDRSLGPPVVKPAVPHFNFAPLHNALERLQAASASYQSSVASGARATPEINRMLAATERLMTREHGLPGRAWYKHHLYAPGFYTGYGVKTIPGVREAIEQREYTHVDKQIAIAADVLDSVSAQLEKIVQLQSR
jgi:N-acetylated-alpha-linked acidic dipeptidase